MLSGAEQQQGWRACVPGTLPPASRTVVAEHSLVCLPCPAPGRRPLLPAVHAACCSAGARPPAGQGQLRGSCHLHAGYRPHLPGRLVRPGAGHSLPCPGDGKLWRWWKALLLESLRPPPSLACLHLASCASWLTRRGQPMAVALCPDLGAALYSSATQNVMLNLLPGGGDTVAPCKRNGWRQGHCRHALATLAPSQRGGQAPAPHATWQLPVSLLLSSFLSSSFPPAATASTWTRAAAR